MRGLDGQTMIVTGATGGIGAAVAMWAAAKDARVMVTGRRGTEVNGSSARCGRPAAGSRSRPPA